MNVIDIIILICCVPAIIQGLNKGFISQAFSLVAIVLGAWVAFRLSNPLGEWIKNYMDVSGTVIQVVSFAIILTIMVIVTNLFSKIVEGVVKVVLLGWLNKLLGAAFALLKVIVILGLLSVMVDAVTDSLGVQVKAFENSVLYPILKNAADTIFPYLKGLIMNK